MAANAALAAAAPPPRRATGAANPPKPVTPVESQLLELESLTDEMHNALHLIIDPLRPILNHDPRDPAPTSGDAVDAEVTVCPLEERIAALKERARWNLRRLQTIHDAIRL